MKFYEKYPKLQEKAFLKEMLTNTIFSTMSLENQEVPKAKIAKVVDNLLKKQELKGNQFFGN